MPAQALHAPAGRCVPGSGTARSGRRGCARRSAGRPRARRPSPICLGWCASSSTGRSGSAPGQRRAWSAPWPGRPDEAAVTVVDAGDHEPGAVALDHDVPVVQRLPAELVPCGRASPGPRRSTRGCRSRRCGPAAPGRRRAARTARAAAATVPSAMSPVWQTMSASSALTASITRADQRARSIGP